ncbi:MAG: uracil-DNA glycosylase family protein, partial [Prevotellaceae bacterium]|nr:uracil-DNA glycosylase family protein [Prevotellaceae bacterium]
MLGSFPPQGKRWSMDFYYPNFNNDMWRIMGLIFFHDKSYFVDASGKAFDKTKLVDFLTRKGIALYDTATAVRRLNDNASDKFLEIVEATDIRSLLRQLP